MTKNEKDYQGYIQYVSNACSIGSVFAGFTFTSITLLIALLPDPSSIKSQLTLFFLAVLFDLLIFLVGWGTFNLIYFCKHVPPSSKQLVINTWLTILSYSLFASPVILMFLIWNLIYLALASTIVCMHA